MGMFDKLDDVERKFEEIDEAMSSGELSGKELMRLSIERGKIADVVETFRVYKITCTELEDTKEMLGDSDPDVKAMAKEEYSSLTEKVKELEDQLTILTLPTDPNDHKNVMLEIRAGTGGDEAALFAGDLFRMYTKFAEKSGWRVEIMSATEGTGGAGYKEVIALISGERVFSRLKFESGVHRVQRVPATETQGRVHTSACTVAVLAEVDEVDEIDINPADLDIGTYRASGAGGQHVNTTDSAVRIVHKPTGIVSECQDERSQHKNKDKAMKVLKARILEKMQREQEAAVSSDRKEQVGSGDRSERIRTYNFPQGRLTDHRINLTLYKLDAAMEGEIEDVVNALGTNHQQELLKQQMDGGL